MNGDYIDPNVALDTAAPDIYSENTANQMDDKPLEVAYIHKQLESLFNSVIQPLQTIKTGFSLLDAATGGLYDGVSVIGAMSGKGKTAIASQIAAQVAQNGVHVIFLSFELPKKLIFERITAANARIFYNIFNNPTYWKTEIYTKTPDYIFKNIALYDSEDIEPTPYHTAAAIQAITAAIRKENENQEILFIIDYLQYLDDERKKDEWQSINQAFKIIEKTAKANKIKVLLISQLNRAGYQSQKDDSGGIQMQAFKGSSRIENGANLLIGLCKQPDGSIRLNIAKNRYFNEYSGNIDYDYNGVYFTEKDSSTPLERASDDY